MSAILRAFKGFDKELNCRGFKYEIGQTYEEPNAQACHQGFHACERPLDVFSYYPPATSRYCEVEQSGVLDRDNEDSKIASSRIKIGAEIGLPGLVKAQIEYTRAHTTTEYTDPKSATAGYSGAATAGYSGAATAGDSGAATAGDSGAATAGKYGAATAGDSGAATSRGSSKVGEQGLAVARGNDVKVMGGLGAVLVLCEEETDSYDIKKVRTVVVDGVKVKANTWYTLKNGRLKEVLANE